MWWVNSPIKLLFVLNQVTLLKIGDWIQWSLKFACTVLFYNFQPKKYLSERNSL
jgi:hypothetical protein